MTIASFVGVLAGFLTRMALYSGMFGGRRNDNDNGGAPVVAGHHCWSASSSTPCRFLLTRALSRYRELAADRAGAFLTGQPSALASALTKITGEMGRIPTRDLRQAEPFNAFFFTPALGAGLQHLVAVLHPPLAGEAARPARRDLRRARPRRRGDVDEAARRALGRTKPVAPDLDSSSRSPDAAMTLEAAMGLRRPGVGSVCFRPPRAARSPPCRTTSRRCWTPTAARRSSVDDSLRLHLAARAGTTRPTCPAW